MKNIMYNSTNMISQPLRFKDALLRGQAPDKGLYIPDRYPKISFDELISMENKKYHEVAFEVMNKFLNEEVPEEKLRDLTKEAYNFDTFVEHVDEKFHLMRLDKGPTASFKDYAARMMGSLMQHYLDEDNKKLTILTATSGDTGSAVANAFHNRDNIQVVVLFPQKEVTKRQRKQMTTLDGNVTPIAVKGKFDDCQSLVKQAFSDNDFRDLNLSSANSINIGRLLPQTVYYFYGYTRLGSNGINYSVPCGNFGNLTGGLIARKMGLPIRKFVAAVNENNEFPVFMETEQYKPIVPSKNCLSNAMNVGDPSNLKRIVAMYDGRMNEKSRIIKKPNMNAMRNDIFSISITDSLTKETIKDAYQNYDLVLEPHGAVAWAGSQEYMYRFDESTPLISLETADPAKFPEVFEEIGIRCPKLPESMKIAMNRKEHFSTIDASYSSFKKFLTENFK